MKFTEINLKLDKLYQYLQGAYHATENDNAAGVLHEVCHRIEDIQHAFQLLKKDLIDQGENNEP